MPLPPGMDPVFRYNPDNSSAQVDNLCGDEPFRDMRGGVQCDRMCLRRAIKLMF